MEVMNVNGSVGEPFNKPLKQFCIQVDTPIGLQYEMTTNMFWEEAEAMKRNYLKGNRAYPIFALFPKIEPTPLDKDKVRNILNPELAHKLVAREVLLPTLCFIERYRYESECAVGINPYGHEWDELYKRFFDHKRCFAMDYSAYDLRMSAQIALAVYGIMAYVAKQLSEDPHTASYVYGIATDATYPLINVSGEMLEPRGSFTSGSVETSVRNSIANSLLLRVAYYCAYAKYKPRFWWSAPQFVPPFRQNVFLLVYGDDNIGCVRRQCSWFNMKTVQAMLGEFGYVVTDADKSQRVPDFINLKNVDFLKRGFVYNPELGFWVGALHYDSILKRLVSVLRPTAPLTVRQITLQNIDSALDEWFLYGRFTYENKRSSLKIAIANSPENCITPSLEMCYEQRLPFMRKRTIKGMETGD